jgi:hypothetical protein
MLNSEERKDIVIEAVSFASGGLHVIYSNEMHPTETEISPTETEIPPTEIKYLRLTTKSVSF